MSEDASKYLRSDAWPAGTRLQLLNVPWDENYRDVVAWESEQARDEWFSAQQSESWYSSRFNYLWPNQPIAVPVPYSSAYRYNYVAVTNPEQPVDDEGPQRTYYYFVTDVSYLSPQASNLTVQLDVMTTYCGSIEFGRAFVERGHIAMANGSVNETNRMDYLTLPEGLDLGSEYLPVGREFVDLMGEDEQGSYVVIVSTARLTDDPGDVSEPNLATAEGSTFDGFPNGCNIYAIPVRKLRTFMAQLSNKSWVAQCVIDLYLVPGALIRVGDATVKLFGDGMDLYIDLNSPKPSESFAVQHVADLAYTDADFVPFGETDTPEKLFCYPYSVIELSTLTGNPVFLKPEYALSGNAFLCYGFASAPSPRFCVFLNNYQGAYQSADIVYDVTDMYGNKAANVLRQGTGLDNALWFTDFPHLTLVNNNYQLYLASNANRIAYQYQSAGWWLDRSNMMTEQAYENVQLQANTSEENARRTYNAQMQNTQSREMYGMFSHGMSGLTGIASNPTMVGVGVSVANTAVGVLGDINTARMSEVTSEAALANSLRSTDTGLAVAGRNADVARRANHGDYQNRIAGIEAKVQDAALTAPSTVGQMGGDAFNWKNSLIGFTITYKTIAGASRRAVIDYFRRYGYAVRRWLPMGSLGHLLCMSKFAYWKVLETTVTAADANESEKHTMRGVFEKGVTLWDAPESIGTTDLTANQPKDGYYY